MKKILKIAGGMIFVAGLVSLGMSQEQTQTKPRIRAAEARTFTGIIAQLTLADPDMKTNTELTIAETEKNKMTFVVRKSTALRDVEGQVMAVDQLKAGDKVQVRYTTDREGRHIARSIRMEKL
jgi:hypothetical protein